MEILLLLILLVLIIIGCVKIAKWIVDKLNS